MGWIGRTRRGFAAGLALSLLAPFAVPAAPALADDGDARPLQDALGEVLSGLAGVDTADAVLDPIPLTPASLDQALSLPATLAVLERIVRDAAHDLEDLEGALEDGIDLDDFDLSGELPADVLDTIEQLRIVARDGDPTNVDLDAGVADLTVVLERQVDAPLVALSDLVAYDADALPVTAEFTADLDLAFDPAADDLDLEVTLGQSTLGAQVGATFGTITDGQCEDVQERDPLGMNVGILAVEATGEVCGEVSLQAGADAGVPLEDWTTTPARDLFAIEQSEAAATVGLAVTSELEGLGDETGRITLDDWDATTVGGLTAWQDEVTTELGALGDFRNIELEEVVAGIAQLAVSLGATQLSGAADLRLPLLRERGSELAHVGQGLVDWLLAQEGVKPDDTKVALARLNDEGQLQLLDELDREALVALRLTDLQSILASLEEELEIGDVGASYAPDDFELSFDLAWNRGVSDVGLPGDRETLRFNLSDRLAAASGVSGLVDAGGTEISVEPHVEASLGVVIDLAFDQARADLAAVDYDLDEFEGDPKDIVAIGERVKLDTGTSSAALDLPVTGTLDLTGTIGMLGIAAETATDALRIESSDGGPMLSITFEDGDDEGYLTLDELVDGLVEDADSTIDVELDVTVPEFDLDLTADVGGTELTGPLGVGVTWDDIDELPDLDVDTADIDDLLDFQFSADRAELLELLLRGVDELTQRLEEQVRAGTELGTIPLVDVEVADLVVGLREVRDQLGEVATDPAATLQGVGEQLDCLLVEELGAGDCDSVQLVTLDVLTDENDPTTVVLRADVGVCSPPDGGSLPEGCALSRDVSLPFQLDLADLLDDSTLADMLGSVVGTSSGGQVDVDYEVVASLHAGVELPDVVTKAGGVDEIEEDDDPEERFNKVFDLKDTSPRIVLFDSTGVRGEVEVDAVADLEVTVGPLSAAAGDPGRRSTEARLGAAFALEHADVDYDIGELGEPEPLDDLGTWIGGLGVGLDPAGTVQCPAGHEGEAPVTITGTVEEIDGGGAIQGATVTVDDGNGTNETATTDADGAFTVDGLPTGTYTVTADGDDHEPEDLTGVELTSGQTATVAFELAPTPPEPEEGEEPQEPEDGTASLVDTETDTQAALEEPTSGEDLTDPAHACARLPLYLDDGNAWIGDIVFTAPHLLRPDGDGDADPEIEAWNVEVPDDLVDRLGDALLDWSLLFDGLRYVVEQVATGLDGAATGVRVPVVGEVLDGGADLADELDTALAALADDIDDADLDDADDLEEELQDALDTAFASLGSDATNPVTVDVQCGSGSCDGDEGLSQVSGAEVSLDYGDEVTGELPGFDLGFPGLSLSVDHPDQFDDPDDLEDVEAHALTTTVDWGLDLTVGLERSGFYLRTQEEGADPDDYLQPLSVGTTVDLPTAMTGDLALLRVAMDKKDPGQDDLDLRIGTEVRAGTDGKAPLHQLLSELDKDTFVVDVSADVDLAYEIETSAALPGQGEVDEVFPTLLADFLLEWSLDTDSSQGFRIDGGLSAPGEFGFDNVRVDLGEFVGGFLGPVLSEVERFTAPFQPVIDTISTPIPGLSDLSEAMGLGPITMLTLFEEVNDNDLTFVKRIIGVVELANEVGEVSSTDEAIVEIGSFDLDAAEAQRGAKPASKRGDLIDPDSANQVVADGGDGLLTSHHLPAGSSSAVTRSRDGGGFSFPAYENPSQLFGMLIGQDVALVRWDSGTLRAAFAVSYNFPPIMVGPVPIGFSLSAAAQIAGRFAIGYDTYGIRRAVDRFKDLDGGSTASDIEGVLGGVSMLFNGVFLDDLDGDGNDVPELILSAEFAAGAGVSLGVISAGLELGLRALIDFDLRDPTGTGRIRIQHILDNLHTPICLFEVGGQLDVFLRAFVKVSLAFVTKKANFTIFEFTLLRLDDLFAGVCAPQPPNLAEVVDGGDGSVLVLNTGDRGGERGVGLEPNGDELVPVADEEFVVRPLNADKTSFSVAAFGEYEEYHGVTGVSSHGRDVKIFADGADGDDKIQLLDGVESDVDEQIDADEDIETTDIPMDVAGMVCGGSGGDVLVGGRGDDLLVGDGSCSVGSGPSIGIDLAETPPETPDDPEPHEDGNDRLYATEGDNLLFGLGGGDQLYGGSGGDALVGGSGDDQLQAGDPESGSSGDVLVGGGLVVPPGAADTAALPAGVGDLILPSVGAPGNDELYGGAADDVLIGDGGGAHLDGSVWTNVWTEVSGSGGDDYLEGGRGEDRLFGASGEDELYGGRGDDLLDGAAGPDVLVGGTAEDDGRPGSNVLVGGPGDDRMVAHDATVERDEDDGTVDTVTPIDGDAGDPAVLVGGSLTDASSPGDDDLTGSAGDDLLLGDNGVPTDTDHQPGEHGGGVVVYPAALGADVFDDLGARDGDGYPTGLAPISTAGGEDRLAGGPGDDTAIGGSGHDVLVGGWPVRSTASGTAVARIPAGDDLLIAGDGSDLLVGDHADVVPRDVEDEVGADVDATVLASSDTTSNRLIGGSWGDAPIGGSAPGDDRLLAGRHGDVLVGDDGRITADGTVAGDREVVVLLDTGGEDELIGGAADDRLLGGPNDDLLRGTGGDDDLEGGPADDELYGGAADDILIGGSSRPEVSSGDDLLVGGAADEGDALAGDNARIERVANAHGLHDSPYLVELFDQPVDGHEPDEATAGADVLVGGDLGRGVGSRDLLLGQGGADLLFGDGTRRATSPATGQVTISDTWGPFAPLERGAGGDDHLSGGPDDDAAFGGPGRDVLLGGSGVMTAYAADRDVPGAADVHRVPAVDPDPDGGLTSLEGTPAGDDLLAGGHDEDLLLGDNARAERVPDEGIDGTEYVVERFDLAPAGSGEVLGGDDVLIGDIPGGADAHADDVLYGLGGDDLAFGDDALLVADDPDSADDPDAEGRYGEVGVSAWGRFVPVEDGSGGRDRLEGSAGDDALFGGPEHDVLVGGSDRHQPFDDAWDPFPDDWSGSDAPDDELLRGQRSGDDLLVGGRGGDLLLGDNARVGGADSETEVATLFGVPVGVTAVPRDVGLYDVADAGEAPPHDDTAGDDEVIGGAIGRPGDAPGDPGDDVGFGQGGRDLLLGDHATRLLGEDRGYAPLLLDAGDDPVPGGEDRLEGGPGDDVLFGGPSDDTLLGGTSDVAVEDAAERGVVAGDDLLVGNPGRDMALGDNGRVVAAPSGDADLPSWWQDEQVAGAALEPFDEHVVDGADPHADTFGDDLLVGGTLRGALSGLEGSDQDGTEPGDDLMHGQAGDDALFGDDVEVTHTVFVGTSAAGAWQALRRALAHTADGPIDDWRLGTIDHVTDGDAVEVAAGGDDLLLGGPDDDLAFGGPGQDDLLGGSWDEGRLDGRDEIDAGPGHDVATGDNARLTRPLVDAETFPEGQGGLEDGLLLCQTYLHREESALDEGQQADRLSAWRTATGGYAAHETFGPVTGCVAGGDDPDPDGLVTRVVREVEMLDEHPEAGDLPPTAGSDLIWGGDGDDTLIGQFDDTEAFDAADQDADPFRPELDEADEGGSDPQRGWRATRVVEWCRMDGALLALLGDEEAEFDVADLEDDATVRDYLDHYFEGEVTLEDFAFAGDVLCAGAGEDTTLGDQGLVTDIVEDGGREEVIEPQQPFVSHTRFVEGTRTRRVEITDEPVTDPFEENVGGRDLLLGGPGGDALHAGAGEDLANGNAGDDHLFGGDGDDVLWGGRDDDHVYSGHGDTHLDVRPRPATDSGFAGDPAAWFLIGVEADTYQDVDEIYGGWGQDALQADEASEGPNEEDRLMAWAGAHNLHYVCAATYGAWVSIRNIEPGLLDYLIDKAEGHGALDPGTQGTSGFRELALVYNRDMRHNSNPPHPETPGNFTCGAADPAD